MTGLSLRCPNCDRWLEVEDWEAAFIVQAREGWPHAIELVRELVGVIDDLCRQINQCGRDEQMWEVYRKAKEMLGDE